MNKMRLNRVGRSRDESPEKGSAEEPEKDSAEEPVAAESAEPEAGEDTTDVAEGTDDDASDRPASDSPTPDSVAAETDEEVDRAEDEDGESAAVAATTAEGRINWTRVVAYGVLPAVALLLAMAAGFLRWQDSSVRHVEDARIESVRAATDSTIALLSYRPDTVERDLTAAQGRLTGTFLDAYTELTRDVVIPGAKQRQVSAVATVAAASSVSADPSHAVVLLCVDQTVTVGQDPPTDTPSSVQVTLEKIDGRWLISSFEPI